MSDYDIRVEVRMTDEEVRKADAKVADLLGWAVVESAKQARAEATADRLESQGFRFGPADPDDEKYWA